MNGTEATDGFLSGTGVPVDPREIEAALTRLWGPSAEQAGGPEVENPNVTRIVLANVVVIRDGEPEGGTLDATIDEVVRRFPCRLIVVRRLEGTGGGLTAEVSALCRLPAPGRPQVCAERIVLNAPRDSFGLVPGAVRPLLEPDLPFVLWWTFDPRSNADVFRTLASECSRLVLDLPDPVDADALRLGLNVANKASCHDAAWFGLTRPRELVAQFFDAAAHPEALDQIVAVEVRAAARNAADVPRQAVWIVAWLAGRLGWTPVGQVRRAPGTLDADFESDGRAIVARIVNAADPTLIEPSLLAIQIDSRDPATGATRVFRLSRHEADTPEIHIDVEPSGRGGPPRVVVAPAIDAPRRIAAALESARVDRPFHDALPHALRLLGD